MLLKDQFKEIEQLLVNANVKNERVSKATIAWQLDHALKVIASVAVTVKKSDPSTYKSNFNYLRAIFFLLEWFPRGKAKAPKFVRTYESISIDDLKNQLVIAKQEVDTIINLDSKSHFRHPIFGVLNLKQTKKFLRMHTEHHLKICRDILK